MIDIKVQFKTLVGRNLIAIKRNPFVLLIRVAISIIIVVNELLIFWKVGKRKKKLFELTSSIYFHSFTVLFFSMFATLLEFQKEGQIFAKEYQSNMYGTFVYYISKLVIEMPILIVMPLVETLAIFWVIGYNEEAFWQFYFVMILIV